MTPAESTRRPDVTAEAVERVQKALGCEEERGLGANRWCHLHDPSGLWTDRGCPVAVAVVDALDLPALEAKAGARALREAADEFEEFAGVDDERFKRVNTFAVRMNAARILRRRADWIEGGEPDQT